MHVPVECADLPWKETSVRGTRREQSVNLQAYEAVLRGNYFLQTGMPGVA
jgi:hypothetical protein